MDILDPQGIPPTISVVRLGPSYERNHRAHEQPVLCVGWKRRCAAMGEYFSTAVAIVRRGGGGQLAPWWVYGHEVG